MEIISLLSIVQSFLGMTESKYMFTKLPPFKWNYKNTKVAYFFSLVVKHS